MDSETDDMMKEFRDQVAAELGLPASGDRKGSFASLGSRECGRIGGVMVRAMIRAAREALGKQDDEFREAFMREVRRYRFPAQPDRPASPDAPRRSRQAHQTHDRPGG